MAIYKVTVESSGMLTFVLVQLDITETISMSNESSNKWTGESQDIEVGDSIVVEIRAAADATVNFDYKIENISNDKVLKEGSGNTEVRYDDEGESKPQIRIICRAE